MPHGPALRPDGRPRVVVTGVGPVSSIGIGSTEFTRGLWEGRSGSSPVRSFDTEGFPHFHACEVHDFRAAAVLQRVAPDRCGRSSQFAAAAARLAVEDAGLAADDLGPRAGVVFGTTCGETQVMEALTARFLDGGHEDCGPLSRQLAAHRLAHAASEEIGALGESLTVGGACAAGNHAIGLAYDSVVDGEADVMVAGGAESVCRFVHAGFLRLGVLAEDTCAPFDRDRQGILTAEGGAALVLERLDHAVARDATPYAEILGYAINCDAHHMVSAVPESIAVCMRGALAHAGVEPDDVDYISAHGTGTPANDAAESWAIADVFGERMPPAGAIKSMIGHTMGAASAFGAIASVLAISGDFMPPTMNWRVPDPALHGIDPVPNAPRPAAVHVVQNNGFGFGGNNAVVVFGGAETR